MSIQFKTITEIKKLLRENKISHVELIQETLDLINQLSDLNCFITTNDEYALRKAKDLDLSKSNTSISGIPIAHKDLFCTKGTLTTCGSKMLSNFSPPYDATVVSNLENADVINVGKTNMDEFAMGSTTETSFYKPAHNPWKKDYIPGGSSGGSAIAVAAGIVPAATGTDTGGSIRQPAALCGVTGIKPTYGRVSRWGMVAFASSLDQAGPICRTAEDCALILDKMAGFDEKDTTSLDIKAPKFSSKVNAPLGKKTIGIVKEFMTDDVPKDVATTFENSIQTLESIGCKIKTISLPNIIYSVPTYYVIAPAECSSNLSRYDGIKFGHRSKNAQDLESLYINSRTEGFGDEVKRRILIGTYVLSSGYYDAYYKKAQQVRRLIKEDFEKAFKKVDLIMTPTSPSEAFKIGSKGQNDPTQLYLEDLYTISSNLAGLPALSMPHGEINGLPIGLQLIGDYLDEETILNVANIFQKNTDFHNKKPSLEEWL